MGSVDIYGDMEAEESKFLRDLAEVSVGDLLGFIKSYWKGLVPYPSEVSVTPEERAAARKFLCDMIIAKGKKLPDEYLPLYKEEQ